MKAGRALQVEDLLKSESAKREVASILRCDLTLMISVAEMEVSPLYAVDRVEPGESVGFATTCDGLKVGHCVPVRVAREGGRFAGVGEHSA